MALVSINWNPSERLLRQFAVVGGLFALSLAGWLYIREGWTPYVGSLTGLGLGIGVLGSIWPETMRYLYIAMVVITFPIGWTISQLVLMLIYYGIFTPIAVLFRLVGRDALQRRFEPAAASYWQPKRMPDDPRQYLRQY